MIPFLLSVIKEFNISKSNIIHCGDEVDHTWLSKFPKSPDMRMSAVEEFEATANFFCELYGQFPVMRLVTSNHGIRPMRRLLEAGIPSLYMKSYQELLNAPKSWCWARSWRINTRHPWMVEHGTKYSGIYPGRLAAINNCLSTAVGHTHAAAGISYLETEHGGFKWGFCTGALIDREAISFEYAKENKFLANIGVGVVVDSGFRPIWVPLHG